MIEFNMYISFETKAIELIQMEMCGHILFLLWIFAKEINKKQLKFTK